MGEQLSFYSNQLFIKKEPTCNIEKQKEALEELKYVYPLLYGHERTIADRVSEGKSLDKSALISYSIFKARADKLERTLTLPQYDIKDCLTFWFLCDTDKPNQLAIRGQEKSLFVASIEGEKVFHYDSLEDLHKDFIPLDTVLVQGEFVGRRARNIAYPIYVIYKYGNIMITCGKKRDGKTSIYPARIEPVAGLEPTIEDIVYGPVNESLRGTEKVLRKVYTMQDDYRRQID